MVKRPFARRTIPPPVPRATSSGGSVDRSDSVDFICAAKTARASTLRILVLEPDLSTAREVESLARSLGLQPTLAHSVRGAERAFAAGRYDGVVAENKLGDGNACHVLAQNRTQWRYALIISDCLDRIVPNRAHELGAQFVCRNPRRVAESAPRDAECLKHIELFTRKTVVACSALPELRRFVVERLAISLRLGPRRRMVLQLCAEGYDRATIAVLLDVSVSTVQTHVDGIFDRIEEDQRPSPIRPPGARQLRLLALAIHEAMVEAQH